MFWECQARTPKGHEKRKREKEKSEEGEEEIPEGAPRERGSSEGSVGPRNEKDESEDTRSAPMKASFEDDCMLRIHVLDGFLDSIPIFVHGLPLVSGSTEAAKRIRNKIKLLSVF